jgi:hypothetical protein
VRLFSYIVARDFGFAPNPFHGVLTLATCKPKIRAAAAIGDLVVGTGSRRVGLDGHIVFAMKVSDVVGYDEYWADPRYQLKRPNLRGSLKYKFGDNIYHRSAAGQWTQSDSHHSLPNGVENPKNVARDTETPKVLIAREFIYWGASAPRIPRRLRDYYGVDLCAQRQGHLSAKFSEQFVRDVVTWLKGFGVCGLVGEPREFMKP